MKRIRTAIIGTGFMGRVHLEAVRRLGFVEVAAIAGRRIEAARSMADAFHIERVESHYDRILADPEIQAIHICTPNSLHAPIAKAALAAGKHVLCEKPLAMSTKEAQEIETLARSKNLRNCTCHNLRYYPMVQQMARFSSCRVHILRIGFCTTPIGTGGSSRTRTALPARWPISDRTGATWPST
jgi:predicted dehydrogenase